MDWARENATTVKQHVCAGSEGLTVTIASLIISVPVNQRETKNEVQRMRKDCDVGMEG